MEDSRTSGHSSVRSVIFFLLKILLAGSIVYVLVSRQKEAVMECLRNFDYRYLLPAVLLYFFHMVVCGLRWRVLAGVLGVNLSRMEAVSLSMQGYFFSLVMPSAIGGDLVKIGVLSARAKPGTKVEGAFSILMDRIVGMIGMFLLLLAVTAPAIPILMKTQIPGLPLTTGMKYCGIALIYACTLAGLGASVAIFFHRFFRKLPVFGWLMDRADSVTHGLVSRVTAAADVYAKQPKILIWCIVVSIVLVHILVAGLFWILVAGCGADGATALSILAAVTIGNLIGMIPIFPAGVGGRDLVVITILVAGGMLSADAKTAQLLSTALMISCNLAAGIFFLIDPGRKKVDHAG
ncbi:MAG: flippase-like domain-containing protein [Lentisphaeria bacterium]|nr:flippase-like domain-containing protein [Lentisphaeria bacterium]